SSPSASKATMPTGTSARACSTSAGRVRPMRSWSRWKLERPSSSSATISPSSKHRPREKEPRDAQRAQGGRDLRVLGGDDLAAPAAQLDPVVGARGKHPDAVVL